MSKRYLMFGCICGVVAFAISHHASFAQQQALSVERLTNGARIRVAFEPSIEAVRPLVVQVLEDHRQVALGLVVSEAGLILTKASEIDPIRQLTIKQGREEKPVRVVGWSEAHDLAVLKSETGGWTIPPWNTGADPTVGQFLITPGTEKTPLAVGVISVPRRAVEKDEVHGVLGVKLAMQDGAVIEEMFDDSAALSAGIQIGDEITGVDSIAVSSPRDLVREIAKHQPGETVVLEVRRNGQTLILPATLTHPFGTFLSRIAQQNRLGGEISQRSSGFPVVIQHDSTLKPSECGGPAVNIDGQIVGINIARSGRTESLLIPTSEALNVLQSFREGKLPQLQTLSPRTPPPPMPAQVLQ